MDMEVQGAGEGAAAEASEQRCLNVTAHQLYVLRQLQKGLRKFCDTPYVEEIPSASSVGVPADVAHTPFMELQQQQESLMSGLYWTLCCLALLQPRVAVPLSSQEGHHAETNLVPLPPKVKEDLIFKVILSCLRRRQCTGWVSAAAEVRSSLGLAERGEEYGGSIAKKASQRTLLLSTAAAASLEAKSHAHCDRSAIGFSSNMTEGATATALSTCSGLQALALLDALPLLSEGTLQQLRRFVLSLQRLEDGAFANTLHRRCWSNLCSSCTQSAAGAPVSTVPAAATTEEVEWESEGDVRSTFCCLLSLKLIHAAVKVRHSRNVAVPLPQSCAVAARAVGSAAEEDSAAATPEVTAGERPALFREGPTDPDPSQVQALDEPLNGVSWQAFIQDPLAGVRVDETVSWLLSLLGPDGGVGVSPGAEPHAGAAYCFAGCLSLLRSRNALGMEEARRLERWLRERQLPEGPLQGRPGKQGDTCYTFWVTAALLLLGKAPLKVLQSTALAAAVAAAQHPSGGISRAPSFFHSASQKCCVTSAACEGCTEPSKPTNENNDDNCSGMYNPLSMLGTGSLDSSEKHLRCPDPFHTFFGLAGLSLLAHGWNEETKQLELQQRQPQQEEREHQVQQNLQWKATCKQLLQPLDPQTALPLQLANSL